MTPPLGEPPGAGEVPRRSSHVEEGRAAEIRDVMRAETSRGKKRGAVVDFDERRRTARAKRLLQSLMERNPDLTEAEVTEALNATGFLCGTPSHVRILGHWKTHRAAALARRAAR